ncbi:uncharacterized protein LOC129242671 [Anastrepha obliqua]|uniref:uncharacterized protein LOC129242671 n=1 Tax=Anastrepha obliqua TaxID=95512 RepID=UPI00240A16E9|nr:uncharacterized protein LOC129242671 [Anastrepha obliqua]
MRFPLRRNANVLDTLLSESLHILVVFSIMGWPFSGMQQCETKGMNAGSIQQHNKQQHLEPHLHQQYHQQNKQNQPYQQFHKATTHKMRYTQTVAMPAVEAGPLSGLTFRHSEIVAAVPAIYTSKASSSMSSSLGTHDMHSPLQIIPKDYQHKSAPTSTARGNVPYTQPIATTTLSATNEGTAHSSVSVTDLSNKNVNGVSAQPADIGPLSALASPFALLALHRVSKDTQHSSAYAELPPTSSSNDSLEMDNMDYVMAEHIASLTHATDNGTSMSASASPTPKAKTNTYANANNSSNTNNSININAYNSSSNNQTQNEFMSLSLLSMTDHNMEKSAVPQKVLMDTTLTFSSSGSASLAALSALSSSSSATAANKPNRKSTHDRTAAFDAGNSALNNIANNNNMQHLGSQRIILKTTAKTKTTLATEQQRNSAQYNAKSQTSAATTASATTGSGPTIADSSVWQRGSGKKVENKYVLPKPQKTDAPMLNYIFDTFSSANKHHHHDQRYGPHFEDVQRVGQPTNMTVQAGSSIHLNCRISLLQDKTVSWVRRNAQGENALDLLTVGLHTYTGDKRYKMEFQYPNNWRLKITNVKKDDEAMYECQISTHPPRVIQINLFVNAPKVMIVDEFGDPLQEKYYEIDSTLQLSCVVRNVAMTTSVVFWKHGDDVLNYDVTRGGISVKTELMDDGANSTLSIAKINKSDSGNYTCAISDFQNFSIVVHILNGESFAELHHGAAAPTVPKSFHQQLVLHGAILGSLLLLLQLLHAPHEPCILVHR